MPNYVSDPQHPGKFIDVIERQKINPLEPLPPIAITELLKRDQWTREDALLILAGYSPQNTIDRAGHPVGIVGAGVVFLDGTNQAMLDNAQLQHPRYPQMLYDFITLAEYANGDDKARPPEEWLEWAKGKGFTPYWLDYMEASRPARTVENETVTKQRDEPPGKMPRAGHSKIAVNTAWQIECDTGKRATAKQVIEHMQSLVDSGNYPELLERIPHGVKVVTQEGKGKDYDVNACAKALERWNQSRQNADTGDTKQTPERQ